MKDTAKAWPGDYGWTDLMTLLDRHWPGRNLGDTSRSIDDLRDDLKHDAGVRIVALLRWVDALNREGEAMNAQVLNQLGDILVLENQRDQARSEVAKARAALSAIATLVQGRRCTWTPESKDCIDRKRERSDWCSRCQLQSILAKTQIENQP